MPIERAYFHRRVHRRPIIVARVRVEGHIVELLFGHKLRARPGDAVEVLWEREPRTCSGCGARDLPDSHYPSRYFPTWCVECLYWPAGWQPAVSNRDEFLGWKPLGPTRSLEQPTGGKGTVAPMVQVPSGRLHHSADGALVWAV